MKQHEKTLPLKGCSVLVTRPEHQAEPFCQQLEQAGATVYRFPGIEISPTHVSPSGDTLFESQDFLLFTSSNAVEHSLRWLKASSGEPHYQIAAIGKKTSQTLGKYHIKVDVQPINGFNSESLLALPAMQSVANKRILIIKGEAGRSLLGDTLTQRGAKVKHLDVYKRKRPIPNKKTLAILRKEKIDIITLTSTETVTNVFSSLADDEISWLSKATLLLGSSRILKNIENNHINPYWIAKNPADDEMFSALLEWKTHQIEHL